VSDKYIKSLELAGADIRAFESFGSYQGDWWAKATYNGSTGWVNGCFGSRSACDSFLAEFEFKHHDCINGDECYSPVEENWDFRDGCKECQATKARIIEFGGRYLKNILSQKEAERIAEEDVEWDMNAQEMVDFIKAHKESN
jgi:hypothetical protein